MSSDGCLALPNLVLCCTYVPPTFFLSFAFRLEHSLLKGFCTLLKTKTLVSNAFKGTGRQHQDAMQESNFCLCCLPSVLNLEPLDRTCIAPAMQAINEILSCVKHTARHVFTAHHVCQSGSVSCRHYCRPPCRPWPRRVRPSGRRAVLNKHRIGEANFCFRTFAVGGAPLYWPAGTRACCSFA